MAKVLKVPVRQPAKLSALSSPDLEKLRAVFKRRKFFMLGYPRSGTTLLGRLVRLHPEVDCNWQAHFFTPSTGLADLLADESVEAWLNRPDNRWTKDSVGPAQLIRLACDFIMEQQAEASGAWIVGDKSPDVHSRLRLETLRHIYPDARLVYIVRDGRDVVVSRRYQQFIDLPETMTARDRSIANRLADGDDHARDSASIFTPGWLEREASQWADDVMQTDVQAKQYYGDRYYGLRYEDLLDSPVETMAHLWSFLGVKAPHAVSRDVIEAEMASNPAAEWHAQTAPLLVTGLARGQHGSWRQRFTTNDEAGFKAATAEALTAWGYSL